MSIFRCNILYICWLIRVLSDCGDFIILEREIRNTVSEEMILVFRIWRNWRREWTSITRRFPSTRRRAARRPGRASSRPTTSPASTPAAPCGTKPRTRWWRCSSRSCGWTRTSAPGGSRKSTSASSIRITTSSKVSLWNLPPFQIFRGDNFMASL